MILSAFLLHLNLYCMSTNIPFILYSQPGISAGFGFVLKGEPAGLGLPGKFQRAWSRERHFLQCGGGVHRDSYRRPWNVGGLLGSVGWGGRVRRRPAQGAQSHSSGAMGQARWRLAIWQGTLLFSGERIPGFLDAGKHKDAGRDCPRRAARPEL